MTTTKKSGKTDIRSGDVVKQPSVRGHAPALSFSGNARPTTSQPELPSCEASRPNSVNNSFVVLDDFFGQIKRRYQCCNFTLTETLYTSRFDVPLHAHTQASFGCVLEGLVTEICESRVLHCEPLTYIYRPAGALHEDHVHDGRTRCFTLEISPPYLKRLQEYSAVLNSPTNLQSVTVGGVFQRLYREFTRMDEVSDLMIEGLTIELLAEVSRQSYQPKDDSMPRWLKAANEIVRTQYAQPISITEIAKLVDVHPVHLNRTFRKYFGVTIGEYTRRLKIEYACRELVQSDAPISDISLEAGFYDQSHLSNTFKQIVGISPGKYRTSFRTH